MFISRSTVANIGPAETEGATPLGPSNALLVDPTAYVRNLMHDLVFTERDGSSIDQDRMRREFAKLLRTLGINRSGCTSHVPLRQIR